MRVGCAGSSPSVSDVSVFDGETRAIPFLARMGSIACATPELYGPTIATTFGSAASVVAAAAPLAGSDESSSTRTLIVHPSAVFVALASFAARRTESRIPRPKLVSPP